MYKILAFIIFIGFFVAKTKIIDWTITVQRPMVGLATVIILLGVWLLMYSLEKEGY